MNNTGSTIIRVLTNPKAVLADHADIIAGALKGPDQILSWDFVLLRVKEYLTNNFNGRIVIDMQGGRINSIQDQALIAGGSQLVYYIEKTNQ